MKLWGPRYPMVRKAIVNTRTDRSFRGILWRRVRGYLVLREAELLKAKGEIVQVDGEVLIEAANVDFIQVLN